jgi:penicillin-binding protein-related factor A (putative recombinase)
MLLAHKSSLGRLGLVSTAFYRTDSIYDIVVIYRLFFDFDFDSFDLFISLKNIEEQSHAHHSDHFALVNPPVSRA